MFIVSNCTEMLFLYADFFSLTQGVLSCETDRRKLDVLLWVSFPEDHVLKTCVCVCVCVCVCEEKFVLFNLLATDFFSNFSTSCI